MAATLARTPNTRIAHSRAWRLPRVLTTLLVLAALCGCSTLDEFRPAVAAGSMTPAKYAALQRGDILSNQQLSAATLQTLRATGLDTEVCAKPSTDCIGALARAQGVSDERRLSALAELWLQQALLLPAPADGTAVDAAMETRLNALLETARHAYAYLFLTARKPDQRAFEDRQTQVRDWYNHAVQGASTALFKVAPQLAAPGPRPSVMDIAGWQLRLDLSGIRLPEDASHPRELVPASSLTFEGLQNIYRRDGLGAELVAVMDEQPATVRLQSARTSAPEAEERRDGARSERPRRRRPPPAWSEMPSPTLTVLIRFPGDTLDAVLRTREVQFSVHDPYAYESVDIAGSQVPLAANFSAGYGLWLARSGFNLQSLRTLLGKENGIDAPHLYMMQPYDPDRRIVLMVHGLASSPEAWVNLANEVFGDETLRRNYQVWQVYYPTNLPLAYNQAAIRRLVEGALRSVDPAGSAAASHSMVAVGHSMGGVLTRLMVSTSGEALWEVAMAERGNDLSPEARERIRNRIGPMLRFEPMPQIGRAIFIAAPHRGTEVAEKPIGRLMARLVRLPLTVLEGFADVLHLTDGDGKAAAVPNSIDNLAAHDPFVRAAADLPISPRLPFHSIIARRSADGPLQESNDGLVPYRSAHLPGAVSEKVIVSGHSVQETAPAILEVRRILHEDLAAHGVTTPAAPSRQETPP